MKKEKSSFGEVFSIVIPIECRGRNEHAQRVLAKPVSVEVKVSSFNRKDISLDVTCVHNAGGHGQRCKASYPPGVNKIGEGISCAYAIDIPYATDQYHEK